MSIDLCAVASAVKDSEILSVCLCVLEDGTCFFPCIAPSTLRPTCLHWRHSRAVWPLHDHTGIKSPLSRPASCTNAITVICISLWSHLMTSLRFRRWILKRKEGTALINDNSTLLCNGSITDMKMYFQGCQNKTVKHEKKNPPPALAHGLI